MARSRSRARGVVILEWRKRKPPSPAQLRALGRLPPGAYRVNPNPIFEVEDDPRQFRSYGDAQRAAWNSLRASEAGSIAEIRADGLPFERWQITDKGTFRYLNPARRRNPSHAEREYERFHWGTKAKRKVRVNLSTPRELFEIGKLRRVEYETVKKGERATWYHDFSRPFPSLTATPSGKLGPIVGGRAKVEPRGIVG